MKTLKNKMRTLLLAGTVLVVPFAMAQIGSTAQQKDPDARLARMTQELSLTAEQVAQIERIHAQHEAKVATLKKEADSEQRSKVMKELHGEKRKAVDAVLTSEQRTKAEALRAEHKEKWQEGDRGEHKDPEARAEARTQWMTKELGLSSDQAAKVKAIHLQHMQKMISIKAIEDAEKRKAAMVELRASQEKAIQAVLTADQQARLKALKAERKAEYGERKGKSERVRE